MRVGERAKVIKLNRPVPSKEDRSGWEGKEGLLVRRLNVPWSPDTGELWELRFDSGDVVVFSESEMVTIREGREIPNDLAALKESWGDAPRSASFPFRRFGASVGSGPAILALLFFSLAGVLLVWAGISSDNWLLTAAGAVLVLIGVGAAGVLIS
jgi:hypothetical protein